MASTAAQVLWGCRTWHGVSVKKGIRAQRPGCKEHPCIRRPGVQGDLNAHDTMMYADAISAK